MNCRIIRKWEAKKYFEFKKSDIYSPAFGIGSFEYDPYPMNQSSDVVERRVIGNECFIEGEHIRREELRMQKSKAKSRLDGVSPYQQSDFLILPFSFCLS